MDNALSFAGLQVIVWSTGGVCLYAFYRSVPNVVESVLRVLFGMSKNHSDLVSNAFVAAIFFVGLRIIFPIAGIPLEHFNLISNIIGGAIAFSVRDYISNFVAYLVNLFEGNVCTGNLYLHEGIFYEVLDVDSSFITLQAALPVVKADTRKDTRESGGARAGASEVIAMIRVPTGRTLSQPTTTISGYQKEGQKILYSPEQLKGFTGAKVAVQI